MARILWFCLLAARPAMALAFGPGEKTTYEVSYLGLPAGRATLSVGWTIHQFGQEVWPLVCVGQTSTFGRLWPVDDRFISYWNPRSERPVGADFFVRENKHRRKEQYHYDATQSQIHVIRQLEGRAPADFHYPLESGTVDLASASFSLRNMALAVGQNYDFPVFTGNRLFKMKAVVVSREMLSTALGPLDVFRVTVNTEFQGALMSDELVTLFYTADQKQLPVRAEAHFALGKIRIEAISYQAGVDLKPSETGSAVPRPVPNVDGVAQPPASASQFVSTPGNPQTPQEDSRA